MIIAFTQAQSDFVIWAILVFISIIVMFGVFILNALAAMTRRLTILVEASTKIRRDVDTLANR